MLVLVIIGSKTEWCHVMCNQACLAVAWLWIPDVVVALGNKLAAQGPCGNHGCQVWVLLHLYNICCLVSGSLEWSASCAMAGWRWLLHSTCHTATTCCHVRNMIFVMNLWPLIGRSCWLVVWIHCWVYCLYSICFHPICCCWPLYNGWLGSVGGSWVVSVVVDWSPCAIWFCTVVCSQYWMEICWIWLMSSSYICCRCGCGHLRKYSAVSVWLLHDGQCCSAEVLCIWECVCSGSHSCMNLLMILHSGLVSKVHT